MAKTFKGLFPIDHSGQDQGHQRQESDKVIADSSVNKEVKGRQDN